MLIKVIRVKEAELANFLYAKGNKILVTKEDYENNGDREYTFQLTVKLVEDINDFFTFGYLMRNVFDLEIDDNKFMEDLKNEFK